MELYLKDLNDLLSLVIKKDYDKLKDTLLGSTFHHVTKGHLSEFFIAELLIGNNYWATVNSLGADGKVDIFQYSRTNYNYPIAYYQIKNCSKPLCSAEITKEIAGFQRNYGRRPYKIVSFSVFNLSEDDCKYFLTNYNTELLDYNYIQKLIENYDRTLNKHPGSTFILIDEKFNKHFHTILKYKHNPNLAKSNVRGVSPKTYKQLGYLRCLPDDTAKYVTELRRHYSEGKLNIKKVKLLNHFNFC